MQTGDPLPTLSAVPAQAGGRQAEGTRALDRSKRWVVLVDRTNWSLAMKITTSVSEILENHVTLEVESIDRMYLNLYVPQLQRDLGVVSFIKYHLGQPVPSTVVVADRSKRFVNAVKHFAHEHDIPRYAFKKGEDKETIAGAYRHWFSLNLKNLIYREPPLNDS